METAIVWFRRDLRLADNPALHAAVASGARIVPLYVHAPAEESPWAPGAASDAWLARSLARLSESLAQRGAPLVIRKGSTAGILKAVIRETGATRLYFNRRYEPIVAGRDRRLVEQLPIDAHTFNASLLVEPDDIRTKTGGPYKVFTPFWRAVSAQLAPRTPLPSPRKMLASDALPSDTLDLKPSIPWDEHFEPFWQPGEKGAQRRLATFIEDALPDYAKTRDFPALDGTSRLSPHLHFGEIGPNQILFALASRDLVERGAKFLSELGWREFSYHLLHHFPDTPTVSLDPKFERFRWAVGDDDPLVEAWKRGRTGVPIVDAGMRQLWKHGWMHNRVRMLAASFLSKNLRADWRVGSRWFWDTLVDADLANNTQGWQWVAGSGADASPYFRIFNPVTQSRKFDPDGEYIRRWVPELRGLDADEIHDPSSMDEASLRRHGLTGTVYEKPILDLGATREAALEAYRALRG